MATIGELCDQGIITRLKVALPRGAVDDRLFYALPAVLNFLNGPVRTRPSFYDNEISPKKQALALFQQFNAGKPMSVGRQFKRMRPARDDVFELVTSDLRFFGWFPMRDVYIAVKADFMENTHGNNLYEGYRDEVTRVRASIDLDEPKWIPGATEYDVLSL